MILSVNSYALRCGNTLIEKGMPVYAVQQACTVGNEYHVQNTNNDNTNFYIKEGNFTHKIIFTDGEVSTIDDER